MAYLKKNAKKIIIIVIILLLSPYLIMGSALGLALAYTRWGQMDFRLVGGIALMVLGLGLLTITGNPLYLLAGVALMWGVQTWIKRSGKIYFK